jgi:molybdenum cofactor cytidylyltransferase
MLSLKMSTDSLTPYIIILAAGASTRLGEPKQLLIWKGKSLLQHAIQTAGQVLSQPVVVLGANAEQLQRVLEGANVQIVHNPLWQEGIASSIRCGISAISDNATGAIFMVCDQPYVSADLLKELISEHERTGKPIVASAYGDTVGIPAFFDKEMFSQLLDLQGDTGAKKIMLQHEDQVAAVPFPLGNIDIDTIEEYEALKKSVI